MGVLLMARFSPRTLSQSSRTLLQCACAPSQGFIAISAQIRKGEYHGQ